MRRFMFVAIAIAVVFGGEMQEHGEGPLIKYHWTFRFADPERMTIEMSEPDADAAEFVNMTFDATRK